jgi:hypothetical protein
MASVGGQPAFENWIDEGGGLAKVRYRGAPRGTLASPGAALEDRRAPVRRRQRSEGATESQQRAPGLSRASRQKSARGNMFQNLVAKPSSFSVIAGAYEFSRTQSGSSSSRGDRGVRQIEAVRIDSAAAALGVEWSSSSGKFNEIRSPRPAIRPVLRARRLYAQPQGGAARRVPEQVCITRDNTQLGVDGICTTR